MSISELDWLKKNVPAYDPKHHKTISGMVWAAAFLIFVVTLLFFFFFMVTRNFLLSFAFAALIGWCARVLMMLAVTVCILIADGIFEDIDDGDDDGEEWKDPTPVPIPTNRLPTLTPVDLQKN